MYGCQDLRGLWLVRGKGAVTVVAPLRETSRCPLRGLRKRELQRAVAVVAPLRGFRERELLRTRGGCPSDERRTHTCYCRRR
jgi:hypothetical protein